MNDGLALDGLRRLRGLQIKSIQTGTVSLASVQSASTTINEVDTSRSVILHGGQSLVTGTDPKDAQGRLSFSSSTTVFGQRGTAGGTLTINFTVIEFY